MPIILVTTCTGRKRVAPPPSLIASNLPEGNQDEVLLEWQSRLEIASARIPASSLYCGRGFSEILRASREHSCAAHVISAGLGLISIHQEIPSYNLTVSAGLPESIQAKIADRFNATRWWRGLNETTTRETSPLAALITANANARFLFSLSRAYAEMVMADLLSLPDEDLLRVRIMGLSGSDFMPQRVRPVCMPYDERFDGPNNSGKGTRSDFPQRVLCHFLKHVFQGNENCEPWEHAELVCKFLEGKAFPVRVPRATKTDDQIRAIIWDNWNLASGTSSGMLRLLRDDLKVSCEQKRFAQLFRDVKAERNEQI